jgi:hypothetical protein
VPLAYCRSLHSLCPSVLTRGASTRRAESFLFRWSHIQLAWNATSRLASLEEIAKESESDSTSSFAACASPACVEGVGKSPSHGGPAGLVAAEKGGEGRGPGAVAPDAHGCDAHARCALATTTAFRGSAPPLIGLQWASGRPREAAHRPWRACAGDKAHRRVTSCTWDVHSHCHHRLAHGPGLTLSGFATSQAPHLTPCSEMDQGVVTFPCGPEMTCATGGRPRHSPTTRLAGSPHRHNHLTT